MNAGDSDHGIFLHCLKRNSETTRHMEQGPNQKETGYRALIRTSSPLSPSPQANFFLFFFLEGKPSAPVLKEAFTDPLRGPQRARQAEAGLHSSGLPGGSAEAILLSLPTSACQLGTLRVLPWRRACLVRWSLRMNRRSHTGHTNFFSPV